MLSVFDIETECQILRRTLIEIYLDACTKRLQPAPLRDSKILIDSARPFQQF